MSQIFKGVILLFLVIASQTITAQNYYNSPYTRYKVGDLINSGFANNRALGGSSVALRKNNQINYLNPASYTSQDTNSFLFQVGFTGRFAKVQTSYDADQSNNMNIEYLAIGLPVTRWLKFSAGLVPYSRIQYAFSAVQTSTSVGESVTAEYKGFGGFNEFYVGAGFTIKKVLSLGINLNYLFGSLDRTKTSYLTNLQLYSAGIEQKTNYIASDFYTKLGIQYHPTINEKHNFVIGATLDAKANLKVKVKDNTMRFNPYADVTFESDSLREIEDELVLPNKLGFGLSYNYDDILLVTGEFITQNWTGTVFETSSFNIGEYQSVRFGTEYTPAPLKKRTRESYLKRISYRIGGYYTKTYLNYNNTNISDMGVSGGLGFPWKNARKVFSGTTFNIGYQYGTRGTLDNGLIKENYHIVTFGLILHDFWFLKPKYD
jgi:hypothetical protein